MAAVALGSIISMKGTGCVLSAAIKRMDKMNRKHLRECLMAFYVDDLARVSYKAKKADAVKNGKPLPMEPAISYYDSVPCGKAARNAYRKGGPRGFFEYFGMELTDKAYEAFDTRNSSWSVNTVSGFASTGTVYRRKRDFRSFMVDVACTLAVSTNGKLVDLPQ